MVNRAKKGRENYKKTQPTAQPQVQTPTKGKKPNLKARKTKKRLEYYEMVIKGKPMVVK